MNLKVLDGCLVLIPDNREERRPGVMEQQLKAHQQELALLDQVSG